MHATTWCAFASPKVSLEVTLPPPPGVGLRCWQPQALAKGCNNDNDSLQVLAFDRQNLKCTLISEDATFRWGLGRGSTGARAIVCGPADFIRLCVSFAAGCRRVRHCAHQNTASKTFGHVDSTLWKTYLKDITVLTLEQGKPTPTPST